MATKVITAKATTSAKFWEKVGVKPKPLSQEKTIRILAETNISENSIYIARDENGNVRFLDSKSMLFFKCSLKKNCLKIFQGNISSLIELIDAAYDSFDSKRVSPLEKQDIELMRNTFSANILKIKDLVEEGLADLDDDSEEAYQVKINLLFFYDHFLVRVQPEIEEKDSCDRIIELRNIRFSLLEAYAETLGIESI